jgi:hypothetical protein
MKKQDLTGRRYGFLTVQSQGPHGGIFIRWNCLCDCGSTTLVFASALRSGQTKSCGCYRTAISGQSQKTHGEGYKPTKEYRAWLGMKARCYRKTESKYPIYGGRGIIVCERWLTSYENFLIDMGRAPSKRHSLDRKEVNGNYEPSNCRWATCVEQMNNVRYNKFIYLTDGSQRTVAQLSRETGIKYQTLLMRLRKGWPYHKLISRPSESF